MTSLYFVEKSPEEASGLKNSFMWQLQPGSLAELDTAQLMKVVLGRLRCEAAGSGRGP